MKESKKVLVPFVNVRDWLLDVSGDGFIKLFTRLWSEDRVGQTGKRR